MGQGGGGRGRGRDAREVRVVRLSGDDQVREGVVARVGDCAGVEGHSLENAVGLDVGGDGAVVRLVAGGGDDVVEEDAV